MFGDLIGIPGQCHCNLFFIQCCKLCTLIPSHQSWATPHLLQWTSPVRGSTLLRRARGFPTLERAGLHANCRCFSARLVRNCIVLNTGPREMEQGPQCWKLELEEVGDGAWRMDTEVAQLFWILIISGSTCTSLSIVALYTSLPDWTNASFGTSTLYPFPSTPAFKVAGLWATTMHWWCTGHISRR